MLTFGYSRPVEGAVSVAKIRYLRYAKCVNKEKNKPERREKVREFNRSRGSAAWFDSLGQETNTEEPEASEEAGSAFSRR